MVLFHGTEHSEAGNITQGYLTLFTHQLGHLPLCSHILFGCSAVLQFGQAHSAHFARSGMCLVSGGNVDRPVVSRTQLPDVESRRHSITSGNACSNCSTDGITCSNCSTDGITCSNCSTDGITCSNCSSCL